MCHLGEKDKDMERRGGGGGDRVWDKDFSLFEVWSGLGGKSRYGI